MEWVLLFAVGALAGVAAGLLGIGGGLILVPALSALLQMQGVALGTAVTMAVATALAAIVMTATSSIWAHHRRGSVQWPWVRLMSPWIVLGSILGGISGHWLGGQFLALMFALFALVVAWRMAFARHGEETEQRSLRWPQGVAVITGWISALVGIGGGSITVPYLRGHGTPMTYAVATGAALGYPIALSSALTYVWLGRNEMIHVPHWGYVYWPGLLCVGLSSVACAPWGAALAHRWPAQRLARIFAVLLAVVALKMLWGLRAGLLPN